MSMLSEAGLACLCHWLYSILRVYIICTSFSICATSVAQHITLGSYPYQFGEGEQIRRSLFQLARALLNLVQSQGFELNLSQKQDAFEKWYAANPYLNSNNTKSDYLEEFYEAVHDARKPISEEVLAEAWEKAKKLDLPNEHEWSEDVFLLQKLCHQLQTVRGQQPFFLGTPILRNLFKRHNRSFWHGKLKCLKSSDVILETSTGSLKSHKASEFVYLSHPVWTESEEAKDILEQLMQPQE